ncbi:MAG: D-alanine--D-alanine ligase [Candidatus Omnitrophota bacterium]
MFLEDKNIGIMMGGCSCERAVSLKSGSAVARVLETAGYRVALLDIRRETEQEVEAFIRQHHIDVVFIAMHGGFGEDGRLQRILDKLEVSYTGSSSQASRIAMDKLASRVIFEGANLSVPKYIKLDRKDKVPAVDGLQYPLVVKPSGQGSSIGISFVDSAAGVQKAVGEAFGFDDIVLIEEFIRGREITVAILDGQPLPVVEIIPKSGFFDYRSKYEQGLTNYVSPAFLSKGLTEQIQTCALDAYHALGCRHFARVDMIVRSGYAPFILEVNTIPGLTQTSLFPKAAQAAGIGFDQLCVKLIHLALSDFARR